MPERVYRNRCAGEERIHVELTAADISNLLRDLSTHPHATTSTQQFLGILQESHGLFVAIGTSRLRATGIGPQPAQTPGAEEPSTTLSEAAAPGTETPGEAAAGARPGPRQLTCPQQCPNPDGVTVAEVPPPRYAWGDIFACPNTGCGRHLLIQPTTAAADQSKEK